MQLTDEQRERLARLLDTVRADLRDWTDAPVHDPGIALVELLAYLGDTHADAMGAESFLGSRARRTQPRVTIDHEPWHRVTALDESGPDDPHHVARVTDGGSALIEFGDGVHGRRPPAGGELRVSYRAGGRYRSVTLQQGRVVLDMDWLPGHERKGKSKRA